VVSGGWSGVGGREHDERCSQRSQSVIGHVSWRELALYLLFLRLLRWKRSTVVQLVRWGVSARNEDV
jgi:hypothetical protein